ncbi:hypothetical protein CLIM01_11981 [Colletotrichum limetticola]|uniref:Uncharacterized protein n=1 Tax=Colletotrichum limetticola TaxID=1209924 RepID=A0ABQ9PHI2_9PEZI|nr:hypothetical protein CLIM01_11981 [Colletotrichum limetticola]
MQEAGRQGMRYANPLISRVPRDQRKRRSR